MEYIDIKLISNTEIAPNVHMMRWRRTDGLMWMYTPGQLITLLLPGEDNSEIRRTYSISNLSEDGVVEDLEITVSLIKEGFASSYFRFARPGEEIRSIGPFGKFILNECRSITCIGTSTGITPYRSMLYQALNNPEIENFHVIHGISYLSQSIYAEDFLHFSNLNKKFKYDVCLSKDKSDGRCHEGRVQKLVTSLNVEGHDIYLSGNPYMIEEVTSLLEGKGFRNIYLERYFKKLEI